MGCATVRVDNRYECELENRREEQKRRGCFGKFPISRYDPITE
jgi:hypothetical protein